FTPTSASWINLVERWFAELFLGQRGKPALDQIDPGGAGRGEVQMEAWMTGQPAVNRRRLVGAGVVENQVDVEAGRDPGVDRREELPEFAGALPLMEGADDLARLGVERGKQCGGAMARVVVRPALGLAGTQRQHRLAPVERLNLRLLIDAQHERFVR